MIAAILYTSNSGYTKQYAELLSKATGIPAYNTANSIPPKTAGQPVLYMGWLMAGGLKGYEKAKKRYDVRAVCAVGMAPLSMDQTTELKKKYQLAVPAFYLQGGFDYARLHGVYRIMMGMMRRKILADLPKEGRTEEQEQMYRMCTAGCNFVSEENLGEVLAWLKENA